MHRCNSLMPSLQTILPRCKLAITRCKADFICKEPHKPYVLACHSREWLSVGLRPCKRQTACEVDPTSLLSLLQVYANSIFGAGAQFTSLATLAEQHMAAHPEAADRVKVHLPTLQSTA